MLLFVRPAANPSDLVVRINQQHAHQLGIGSGHLIAVTKRNGDVSSLCWAQPGTDEAGIGSIEISCMMRRNMAIQCGERVRVAKSQEQVNRAELVTIAPVKETILGLCGDYRLLLRSFAFANVPIVVGMIFPVSVWGRTVKLVVLETRPEGSVVVASTDQFELSRSIPSSRPLYLEGMELLAGVDRTVAELRMFLELPLNSPGFLLAQGLQFPRGALLIGPADCGKSLALRSIASEFDGELVDLGEGEVEVLRDLCAQPPRLVLFDDIDQAASRTAVTGVIDYLIAAGAFVLASSRMPDPCLTVPGRLEMVISMGDADLAAVARKLSAYWRAGDPVALMRQFATNSASALASSWRTEAFGKLDISDRVVSVETLLRARVD